MLRKERAVLPPRATACAVPRPKPLGQLHTTPSSRFAISVDSELTREETAFAQPCLPQRRYKNKNRTHREVPYRWNGQGCDNDAPARGKRSARPQKRGESRDRPIQSPKPHCFLPLWQHRRTPRQTRLLAHAIQVPKCLGTGLEQAGELRL